jgi:cardiolipin synthase|tara:strand:- start:261 stop:476 length:216 start_codon:yes stop_codon:yes gene_type:complete
MVGEANLDYLSFFINYELDLATADSGLAVELKEQFISDLKLSELIQPQEWEQRHWLSRWLERIAMILKRWL